MDISLIIGIDFTASNGYPHLKESLHYIDENSLDPKKMRSHPNTLNQYQKAIISVGDILLNYDTDKLVPVYGFGGKPIVESNGNKLPTSHFFPLSGDSQNCAGYDVAGVFEIYNYALKSVELSGPTHFAPLIRETRQFTEEAFKTNNDCYTILLILTDGVIHDMALTVNEIVLCSKLPISIIIVGVGNEDFSQMEALDSDDQLLTGSIGQAERDIVQFVPFRKFLGINQGEQLASEVLEEVPGQVTSFYRSIGKKPDFFKNAVISKTINNLKHTG